MTLYGKFKKLDINFSSLNLESGGGKYFCTPNGARIIGREGVDGIHYCFVKGFGDMVFAVNPSNSDGYVHPLAESFKDFLRLLISCGRTAVLEQALTWNKDEFYEFIKACPLDKGQKALLETIGKSLDLTPMEDPYEYIEALQRSFDCKRLRFSKEYYDLVSDSPPSQPEQRVYFSGGFGRHRGRDKSGREIIINRTFTWGENACHVPSVYSCTRGLVVDLCIEISPEAIKAFNGKILACNTAEEREDLMSESPMAVPYLPYIFANGVKLRCTSGFGLSYLPKTCRSEDENTDYEFNNCQAVWLLRHYGLDEEKGWLFFRNSFPWETKTRPKIKTLALSLSRDSIPVVVSRFTAGKEGDQVTFTHPVTGKSHTLHVRKYQVREVDLSRIADGFKYPSYFAAMSYVIEPPPECGSLTVCDCGGGDAPMANLSEDAFVKSEDDPLACSAVVIGGADGPTSVFISSAESTDKSSKAYSAVYFKKTQNIKWKLICYKKTAEDIKTDLLP